MQALFVTRSRLETRLLSQEYEVPYGGHRRIPAQIDEDTLQEHAGFVKCLLLSKLLTEKPVIKTRNIYFIGDEKIATLKPNPELLNMLKTYPGISLGWKTTMIDGAIEVVNCPTPRNLYGGLKRDQIVCEDEPFEWPHFIEHFSREKLDSFSLALKGNDAGTINGWLDPAKKNAQANRIKILLKSPVEPVLDKSFLRLTFGNSDYFTVRTIQEISQMINKGQLDNNYLSNIFSDRWAEAGQYFSQNCIPYHISAQGIIINEDVDNSCEHLILANTNPQSKTLVNGWGATMAEQMWAPEPEDGIIPWWDCYLPQTAYKPRDHRNEDLHIQDTLIRGLKEEFGLIQTQDYQTDPPLLNISLEQDMYFLTFIFLVRSRMPLSDLFQKWKGAPDHKEMNILAAYQISGKNDNGSSLDGARRMAELISTDEFNSPCVFFPALDDREIDCLDKGWHVSSKMRIFTAGMNIYGKKFGQYIQFKD